MGKEGTCFHGQPRPQFQGADPQRPQLVWATVIYFCVVTKLYPRVKKQNKTPYSCQILNDFQNSLTSRLSCDCVTKCSLNIPSHLKRVTTLPCETLVFKNCSN